MSVTIKDVAKQANVSISTVSRVINNSKPVSDDIKLRVVKVIEELGYKPNPVARSLVTKRSRLLGVIVPDISDLFISELLNAIEEVAKTYDYDIILCNSYGKLKSEEHYLNLLNTKQVEGMVFLTFKIEESHKTFFEKTKMPVVMVNRDSKDINMSCVSIDHYKAMYEMTDKLLSYGHQKIALIRNGKTNEVFGKDHFKGYCDAHQKHELSCDENNVYEGNFSHENAYKICQAMVDKKDVPTAIIATTDLMAVAAINCFVDNGYDVPGDISVVGFYDTKLASLYRPKLTVINQPIYDIGAIAIRMLIKQITDSKKDVERFILPHALIERESAKKI